MCGDGNTYERSAIETWLQQPRGIDAETGLRRPPRSPLTNLPLPHVHLQPVRALRSAIESWFQHYPEMRIKPPRMDLQDVLVAVEILETEAVGKLGRKQAEVEEVERRLAERGRDVERLQQALAEGDAEVATLRQQVALAHSVDETATSAEDSGSHGGGTATDEVSVINGDRAGLRVLNTWNDCRNGGRRDEGDVGVELGGWRAGGNLSCTDPCL